MAGVAGTTVTDELNRLANGGSTYPSTRNYLAEDGAANLWAGTSGYALIGALNQKAGNAPGAFLDLLGVCNQLAGTTGLSASDALRSIAIGGQSGGGASSAGAIEDGGGASGAGAINDGGPAQP